MPQREQLDTKTLDDILAGMVNTIMQSQNQIFEVSERSREESETILKELQLTKSYEEDRVVKNREIEERAASARLRLAEINKHFRDYRQEDIQEAYELANRIEFELTGALEVEQRLRKKRNDLEQQWAGLRETIEHAEILIGRVSVILNYMNGDLRQIGGMVEDVPNQQVVGLKIMEAREEERLRLSREIHDGPAQTLAHVLLESDLVARSNKEKKEQKEADPESVRVREMIRQALSDVRRIIYDLRPMALDDLGLVPTVEKYLYTVEERETVRISLSKSGEPGELPTKMEAALFRLIQEAVQNVCKHADAKQIKVNLTFQPDVAHLIVVDDGKGFDPKEKRKESFGLVGMKERVELLEGEMSIASESGGGTVVMIQVPIQS